MTDDLERRYACTETQRNAHRLIVPVLLHEDGDLRSGHPYQRQSVCETHLTMGVRAHIAQKPQVGIHILPKSWECPMTDILDSPQKSPIFNLHPTASPPKLGDPDGKDRGEA